MNELKNVLNNIDDILDEAVGLDEIERDEDDSEDDEGIDQEEDDFEKRWYGE